MTITVAIALSAEQAESRAAELTARYERHDAASLLRAVIEDEFRSRIALVSSFGSEAAVLLHMVAAIRPSLPILFVDTGKLFGETLRYRDRLVGQLRLTDVRDVRPDAAALADDADDALWSRDPDRCCELRKVRPLAAALRGFAAWVSGRKRFQSHGRAELKLFEATGDGQIKINPLAAWSGADIAAYFDRHALPRHPLVADGFLSIGCVPCTDRVAPGEDSRAGRWRGRAKTECGIHARPPASGGRPRYVTVVTHSVSPEERAASCGHRGGVLWLTGLSGAGKSTLAMALERRLFERGAQVYVLDGDNLRHGLNRDLGFSAAERAENVRRVAEVARLFAAAGFVVVTALISPQAADRAAARAIIGAGFRETYVRASLATCEQRDVKGLYARARSGEIANFTGISAPYEAPSAPDAIIDTERQPIEASVDQLAALVEREFGLGPRGRQAV